MTTTTTINRAQILAQAVSMAQRLHELTAERRLLLLLGDEATPERLDELDQEDAEAVHMCEIVRRFTAGKLTPRQRSEITRCLEYFAIMDRKRAMTGSDQAH